MIRVIVESPYGAPTEAEREAHRTYLRACLRDCLLRGEAPFASHGLYTQPGVLVDEVPTDRQLGIEAGFTWRSSAHKTVVYTDRGISRGMQAGIDHAHWTGQPVVYRELGHG